ncbi:glycosyltransferase family 22 protein [Dorcoceras hygrometricum]|uniref:Glycosyltransferase family 22 protein n=1 Tax=Dorcoceras hygrometricum TaxID=472368 RepID=A0A2Z7AZ36_9LAMI|nr:glycosyltransferase family 22 protein [Dorcoceras hygrometricum]
MVKRLATSPHDPLGITDSACKNQSVMVSIQYGPFNPYIPIRSTIIGKSRVARDPITMHTSWRSNSDITSITSKRVKVRHLSCRVSMTFRVVRTNQYNQDLGLIHSTNGNHLESTNEGSSIDHQVTIHLHAQNITMFLPMKRDDKKPAKERTQRTIPVGTLQNTFEREECVSNGFNLNRGLYTSRTPLKKQQKSCCHTEKIKSIEDNNQRENEPEAKLSTTFVEKLIAVYS